MSNKDKYAFIVGSGDLPLRITKAAKEQNLDFVIVGIKGVSSKALVKGYSHFWFYLGQIASLMHNLKENKVNKIVLAGAIERPSFWAIRLDTLGREIVAKYLSKAAGDNDLLSLIINIFEERGFEVVAPQEIDKTLLVRKKLYTTKLLDDKTLEECAKGLKIAKEISKLDIGQSIITQQKVVVAVEAVEGTAKMILRSKKLLKKYGNKGILVKVKKEGQSIKVDLPTIGDKTVIQVKKANLAGIVIEAENTIMLNQERTIELANKYGIFIIALNASES